MNRRYALMLLLLLSLLTGCWDRIEIEDQLFPVTMAVDRGEQRRYEFTFRVPLTGGLKVGILGGAVPHGQTSEIMSIEADSISEAISTLNVAASRRLMLTHLTGIIIGESLARTGIDDLVTEMMRNVRMRQTAGVFIARGSAGETLRRSQPTGETNPGKINEGWLLVEKQLHLAPHIRLHHIVNRDAAIGLDAVAPVIAINAQAQADDKAKTGDGIAGRVNRRGKNPVEVAGVAIFVEQRLVGFLTIQETQGLLALRGEMGRIFISVADPLTPEDRIALRVYQDNIPQYRASITAAGPVIDVRILMEGEVLSGKQNYNDPAAKHAVEEVANAYMQRQISEVLRKSKQWQADPAGFGLHFRSQFATFSDWEHYRWRQQIPNLRVRVTVQVRVRRYGLIHAGHKESEQEE